eukprot:TRINITY_DN2937_c1_g1_i2.p1 TRINITY_DN2937_c1_g1~~TRINITY_DN2937_c1_g1_i2.p1  ORF type:complete len:132 (+),score=7.08 TRINITY_DN2937_c1_g1_i2:44-439(+)
MICIYAWMALWLLAGWCLGLHRFYAAHVFYKLGDEVWKWCFALGVFQAVCFFSFAIMGNYVLYHCTSCPHPSNNPIAGGCWGDQTPTYQSLYILHYTAVACAIIRWIADAPCWPHIRTLIAHSAYCPQVNC